MSKNRETYELSRVKRCQNDRVCHPALGRMVMVFLRSVGSPHLSVACERMLFRVL